jgi:hypothetical protein
VHDDTPPTHVDDLPATDPSTDEGVHWDVVGWTESKPFGGELVWSDATGPLVWVDLDPILVRDLGATLTRIHAAQRAAMGVSPDPDPTGEPSGPSAAAVEGEVLGDPSSGLTGDLADDEDAIPSDLTSRSVVIAWAKRNRALAVLLSMISAFLLYYFIAGALSV